MSWKGDFFPYENHLKQKKSTDFSVLFINEVALAYFMCFRFNPYMMTKAAGKIAPIIPAAAAIPPVTGPPVEAKLPSRIKDRANGATSPIK